MATPVSRSPGRVVLPNYAYVGIKAAASGDGPGAGIRGPSPLAGARAPAASPARRSPVGELLQRTSSTGIVQA